MRSYLVVISPPSGNGLTGLLQGLKPVLIKALVPEGSVKALDVGVLRWAARFDQNVLDAMLLRPGHECPAGEFWPVVCSDLFGVTPKHGCPIQQAGDVMPTNTEVSCDIDALMAEVVGDRQAFDTS